VKLGVGIVERVVIGSVHCWVWLSAAYEYILIFAQNLKPQIPKVIASLQCL
jgi:hypothetical protein